VILLSQAIFIFPLLSLANAVTHRSNLPSQITVSHVR